MGWWQREKATQPNGAKTTRVKGQQAEDFALAYLQGQGLKLLARNYKTPGRGGGEIDLILRAEDGTVVFVEVRSRQHAGFGGAGGSIGVSKRRRIVFAAQMWRQRYAPHAACRLDVVLIEGDNLQWLPAAFDASA